MELKYFRLDGWVSPTWDGKEKPTNKNWKELSVHPRFGYQYFFWYPRFAFSKWKKKETWRNEAWMRVFIFQFVIHFGFGRNGPRRYINNIPFQLSSEMEDCEKSEKLINQELFGPEGGPLNLPFKLHE